MGSTLLVGTFGFTGVIATLLQRTYADRRAEWWRRATWAVDQALSGEPERQVVGVDALRVIQESKLASDEDRSLFARWFLSVSAPDDIRGINWETDLGGSDDRQ
ncbi:MAG: hypothetical protein WAW85_13295 [Gordonia sp. (in: high G+C Gram-positive bacteria)]|uniref:hypothetical protein n=1 Tax=Gordonia sp. (in: high G+C Gram-positive bacteria) TaxID=84139 RepID=UPI003BB67F13